MAESSPNSVNWVSILSWTVLVILVSVIAFRFSLKTEFAQSIIVNKIEESLKSEWSFEVEISNVKGDAWEYLTFENIQFNSDAIDGTISKIEARFVFLSLLSSEFESITVEGLETHLDYEEINKTQENATRKDVEGSTGSLSVNNLNIEESVINLEFNEDSPIGSLSLKNVNLNGSLLLGAENRISIDQLDVQIENKNLIQELNIELDGELTNQSISLNQLVLGVGKSMINGVFDANLGDNNIDGKLTSENIHPEDILAQIEVEDDLDGVEMEIVFEGELDDFDIKLIANSPQFQNVELAIGLIEDEGYSLNSVSFFSDYINIPGLITSNPLIGGPIAINLEGSYLSPSKSDQFDWSISGSNIEIDNYHFQNLNSEGDFQNQFITGNANLLNADGGRGNFQFSIDSVFSNSPVWNADYFVENVNPKNFNELLPEGFIHASGTIKGNSFSIPDSSVNLTVRNKNPITDELLPWVIVEDSLDEINMEIEISSSRLISNTILNTSDSKLLVEIQAFNPLQESTEYTYQIYFDDLNLGDFSFFSGNETTLNGGIYGIGNGLSPNSANVFGTLTLQNGIINGASLESFDASVSYESGILTIREGLLVSDFADGEVTGQRDIMDATNPENLLSLDLELKDIQPLAGFFGLEILQAKGGLNGNVQQNEAGELIGNFDLALDSVFIDSLFQADLISGRADIFIQEDREFNANLVVENPLIQDIVFQDVELSTRGYFNEDSLVTDFLLTIIGSERGRLIQEGTFEKDIKNELGEIEFNRFDFISPESELILQKPFHVLINEDVIRTDTLNLASESGAFIELSIPYAGKDEQRAYLHGVNFDIGLTQDIIFGNRFIDGMLSADLFYHQTPGDVIGNGFARINEIELLNSTADSLVFSFDIINERLDVKGNIYLDDAIAVSGQANVPFVINKEELDDEFFSRSVRGELEVKPTNLSRITGILDYFGIENTTGLLSFNGEMTGEAGSPQFSGILELDNPELSGIPLDRVFSEFNYSNSTNELIIQTELFRQNTSVAELNIAYPFDVDFRVFEISLPEDDDEIDIRAVTRNLNIAVFNDFVDTNYLSNLNGELNADIQFVGPLGNIKPRGYITISRGSLNVPYSRISLNNVALQVDVDDSGVQINELFAESGNGNISATGAASLDGIYPQEVLLDVKANQFELANTRNLNLEIDLDATLSGEVETPDLIGDLIINQGFYLMENFGEEALEVVELEDEMRESFAPFDSLTIDVIVEFDRRFFIRNTDYLDLEIEPTGLLDLKKNRDEEIELFGELFADDGYVRPLGKGFEVEEGAITFTGPYNDPLLYIRSFYIPQTRQKGESVLLYYNIQGSHLNPEFIFESDPEMEQSDVICYTLFNKPCYSLESWQSVFVEDAGSEAFQELSDVILDEVETLATRELGVDIVQIDNSGQNGATAIRTGWYLNERTFFSIINELTSSTPKTLFVLEYLLNESWDLIITQGDDARQGLDIRYQYDY